MVVNIAAKLLGLVILAIASDASASAAASVTFQSDSSCPTAEGRTALPKIVGAVDRRSCFVECASQAECAAVSADPGTGVCYLASYANWTSPSFWQTAAAADPACVSHIKRTLLPQSLANKMRAFYNFRVSFDNLAVDNSSSHAAQWLSAAVPINVNRSRDGAFFAANLASYIQVTGPINLNASANGFSYFVKLRAGFPLASFIPASLHTVFESTPDTPTGYWKLGSDKIEFLQRSVRPERIEATGFANLSISSNVADPSLVSLGVAYEPATVSYKYFIGGPTTAPIRMSSPASVTVLPHVSTETGDAMLRIGYNTVEPLTGHVICYAIAGTALTEAEMQLIDSVC